MSWVSPPYAYAGRGDLTVTVGGLNFTSSTVLAWNGTPLTVTAQTGTILQATVPAVDFATPGNFTVSATTPGLTGPYNTQSFTVAYQPPVIVSLSPGFTVTGAAGFTLTVYGEHFASDAVVDWNGTALTTSDVSATELRATVPAADVAAQSLAAITVVNPNTVNGVSTKAMFSVDPSGTSVKSMAQTANDLEWDPYWANFYVTVPAGATTNPQSILRVDPQMATVASKLDVSNTPGITTFSPGLLALSQDRRLLFVTGNGWVIRYDALLNPLQYEGGDGVGRATMVALQASPAVDQVVAWIGASGGSARRQVEPVSGANSVDTSKAWDTLVWSPDGGTLYSADGTSSADFTSLSYDITTGPQNETVTAGLWSGTRMQMDAASGLIYADNSPSVIDPAGPMVVATFPVSGVMVPDSTLGCAYFITQTQAQIDAAAGDWTLSCYSTTDQSLTRSIVIPSVVGTPTRMKRWGNEGLAFITDGGYIYFVSGQVVTGN